MGEFFQNESAGAGTAHLLVFQNHFPVSSPSLHLVMFNSSLRLEGLRVGGNSKSYAKTQETNPQRCSYVVRSYRVSSAKLILQFPAEPADAGPAPRTSLRALRSQLRVRRRRSGAGAGPRLSRQRSLTRARSSSPSRRKGIKAVGVSSCCGRDYLYKCGRGTCGCSCYEGQETPGH